MTTTVLFIEHLITGFQAAVWITLFVFSLFGFDWFDLDQIKGLETIAAILVVSVVYPLGVFIDNIADDIFKPWNRKIRNKYVRDESLSVRKLLITTKDETLASYLGYVRTRIRISRSAALNFALITVASVILTFTRLQAALGSSFWKLTIFELVVGPILTIIAIWSWFRITQTFAKQVARGFEMISE